MDLIEIEITEVVENVVITIVEGGGGGGGGSMSRTEILAALGWPTDITDLDIDGDGVLSITKGGVTYTRELFTP